MLTKRSAVEKTEARPDIYAAKNHLTMQLILIHG